MMKYKQQIKEYKEEIEKKYVRIEAENRTVKACQNILSESILSKQSHRTSYFEFLYEQTKFIKKRWWILQGCMEKFSKRKMKNLSGGMVRRVGIAQAMLNDPQILVLDEPTAGLDPNERIRFRNLISELSEERLVLLSTHIVSDIEYIANNIMLMKDGELFYAGTAEDLVSSMKEKVWQCNVSRSMIDKYMNEYLVGNIKTTKTGAELRIISIEKPTEDAVAVEKNLEDAFLFYFGEKSEEKQDA